MQLTTYLEQRGLGQWQGGGEDGQDFVYTGSPAQIKAATEEWQNEQGGSKNLTADEKAFLNARGLGWLANSDQDAQNIREYTIKRLRNEEEQRNQYLKEYNARYQNYQNWAMGIGGATKPEGWQGNQPARPAGDGSNVDNIIPADGSIAALQNKPPQELVNLDAGVLSQFDNQHLLPVINYAIEHGLPNFLLNFSGARLAQFDQPTIRNFIANLKSLKGDEATLAKAKAGAAELEDAIRRENSNNPAGPGNINLPPYHTFNPTVRSGSIDDLLAGGFQGGGLDKRDVEENILPFDTDMPRAVGNVLRGYGFSDAGPLWNLYMQNLPGAIDSEKIQRIMAGGTGDNYDLYNNLGGLGGGFGTGFADEISKLLGNTSGSGYTSQQGGLRTELLDNPQKQLELYLRTQGMPKDLLSSAMKSGMNKYNTYKNLGASMPNKSFWDFLRGL